MVNYDDDDDDDCCVVAFLILIMMSNCGTCNFLIPGTPSTGFHLDSSSMAIHFGWLYLPYTNRGVDTKILSIIPKGRMLLPHQGP